MGEAAVTEAVNGSNSELESIAVLDAGAQYVKVIQFSATCVKVGQ